MKQKSDKPRGFVFFPQDYFGDVAVRMMPGYLRIVWVEAFLLMSDSPQRGVLLKANGQPYKITELSAVMNLSVEHINEAIEWVIREGISGVDRRSKQITNRKMIREEIKRKTASLNGKKGGNPALVNNGKNTNLRNQVNQKDILARAITDPDPDPDPVSSPLKNISNTESIPSRPKAPAEKRGARQRDPAMDLFTEKHLALMGTAYRITSADAVQLSKLRKANGLAARASPEAWETAVENYFASPLSTVTLADLANRFAVFRNSPLDRYRTPVNHANGGTNGTRKNNSAEAKQQRTLDAAQRLRARWGAKDSGGDVG